eukprot:m.201356 g.201356  ORF g.201356 m.201356 type:complete len:538 (-) comp18802_c0_seq4:240-1853(-)
MLQFAAFRARDSQLLLVSSCKRWMSKNQAASSWELCVGLEIHAQILSKSKAFSPAPVADSLTAPPNSAVDILDAGMPGTLPRLNKRCVEAGVNTALALGCRINPISYFDRKHYFYADMPLGFQITQNRIPLAEHGAVAVGHDSPHVDAERSTSERTVTIDRLHLEHDSGKSMHTLSEQYTLVDLNRAGVGLMEIVTGPDMASGDEAAAFVQQIMLILNVLGTCDGNMAEGSLRVDANISVRPIGSTELGTRCEVKNISGLRFLSKAIEYERQRQIDVLCSGECIHPETRNFDPVTGMTVAIRGKEDDTDYRFMPEPDLPPLCVSDAYIADMRARQPELPRQTVERLVTTYSGISFDDAWLLVLEPGAVEFFEAATRGRQDEHNARPDVPVAHNNVFNWMTSELFGVLRACGQTVQTTRVAPTALRALVGMVADSTVSGLSAKKILAALAAGDDREPMALAEDMGVVQRSDAAWLADLCATVLHDNAVQTAQYRAGDAKQQTKILKYFVGQVRAETRCVHIVCGWVVLHRGRWPSMHV